LKQGKKYSNQFSSRRFLLVAICSGGNSQKQTSGVPKTAMGKTAG